MAKARVAYVCNDCGAEHGKWQGQCSACEAWNTLTRITLGAGESRRNRRPALPAPRRRCRFSRTSMQSDGARIATGFAEFDRVLGGGLVPGSVVLIGGEPGAGKSTLLLQVTHVARDDRRGAVRLRRRIAAATRDARAPSGTAARPVARCVRNARRRSGRADRATPAARGRARFDSGDGARQRRERAGQHHAGARNRGVLHAPGEADADDRRFSSGTSRKKAASPVRKCSST